MPLSYLTGISTQDDGFTVAFPALWQTSGEDGEERSRHGVAEPARAIAALAVLFRVSVPILPRGRDQRAIARRGLGRLVYEFRAWGQ